VNCGDKGAIVKLLGSGAAARPGRPSQAVVDAVDMVCNGDATPRAEVPTFGTFAKDWTSGVLARRFPDHVRKKRSSDRDEQLLRLYVLPHVRDVPLNEFDLHDAEIVMANLLSVDSGGKRPLASATRRHVAQVMSRLMHLAVYPGKWRQSSPIPRGWLLSLPPQKAKECLYPTEDALLLGGKSVEEGNAGPLPDVPLLRRLAYGFLAREGMRTEEVANLRWRDVDLKHGRVNLEKDKTNDPRDWDLGPDIVEALRRWKEPSKPHTERGDHVFAESGIPLNVEHLAEQIRNDLRRVASSARGSTRGPRRASAFEPTICARRS
jgi:integrase